MIILNIMQRLYYQITKWALSCPYTMVTLCHYVDVNKARVKCEETKASVMLSCD